MNKVYNNAIHKDQRRELRSSMTEAERILWKMIRNQVFGVRFLRQYGVDPYVLDFYCPTKRLAIEIDGGQHMEAGQRQHDDDRSIFLLQQDIRVIRFWNTEVLNNKEGVWLKIKEALDS